MNRLVKAQKQLASIDRDRTSAMRQRDDAIRQALAEGATYATIREITGMSPSTIAKAIKR